MKRALVRLRRARPQLGDVPYIIAATYFGWMAITLAMSLVTFGRGRAGRGWGRAGD